MGDIIRVVVVKWGWREWTNDGNFKLANSLLTKIHCIFHAYVLLLSFPYLYLTFIVLPHPAKTVYIINPISNEGPAHRAPSPLPNSLLLQHPQALSPAQLRDLTPKDDLSLR